MGNYTPNPSMTQPIYDPTRPFATPTHCIEFHSALLPKKKKKITTGINPSIHYTPPILLVHGEFLLSFGIKYDKWKQPKLFYTGYWIINPIGSH